MVKECYRNGLTVNSGLRYTCREDGIRIEKEYEAPVCVLSDERMTGTGIIA